MEHHCQDHEVKIKINDLLLFGKLSIPKNPKSLIIFAHGSGSSHKSPRNIYVAKGLNNSGFATLLFDLLTISEAEAKANIFDIKLLGQRLLMVTNWAKEQDVLQNLKIGYFGASTGAAAALYAASIDRDIFAIVSRGGRPDMVFEKLQDITCPVLLIVGQKDIDVIDLNRKAQFSLQNCSLDIIPKATHLFEEEGALDEVLNRAKNWFSTKTATKLRPHVFHADHNLL